MGFRFRPSNEAAKLAMLVPKILVLLVRARPRCHAWPVSSLWPVVEWVTPADHFAPFLTFISTKVCLDRLIFL